MYKTLWLVRISLLISALSKSVLLFFSWKFFCKSNRKLFSCVCISWYKHSRGWESLDSNANPPLRLGFCTPVSNSPNPSRVYIGLCKHGKHFVLLKWWAVRSSKKRGARVGQWWDFGSPPTNVDRVRIPASKPYVGWVYCWFSRLLRVVFLHVRFSPLLKNQYF